MHVVPVGQHHFNTRGRSREDGVDGGKNADHHIRPLSAGQTLHTGAEQRHQQEVWVAFPVGAAINEGPHSGLAAGESGIDGWKTSSWKAAAIHVGIDDAGGAAALNKGVSERTGGRYVPSANSRVDDQRAG